MSIIPTMIKSNLFIKRKKCTFLFFLCFKKFYQVARSCLAWLYTSLVGLPGSEHGWAARGFSRRCLVPGHCYLKPLPGFSPMAMSPDSRVGLLNPTSKPLPRAQQPYACDNRHCRMKVDSGVTWLRQQAGDQRYCCPDFFSFWKLKLVRLFSFLCF